MRISVIASGSTGNACVVQHGSNRILIDAGIGIKSICKSLAHHVTELDGALISHEHKDHTKAVRDLMRFGIDCYMSKGTAEALNCKGHRIHLVSAKKQFKVGDWLILPFDLIHDAREPLGFLLSDGDCKLLYACDTAYIPYIFSGITHIMVECNYSLEILREKMASGTIPAIMKSRLMQSHMSLDTVKKFLQANDLSHVQEIWLLHLSDKHSDEAQFKAEIQRLTGKVVKIAP